jgi:hypothetical protein
VDRNCSLGSKCLAIFLLLLAVGNIDAQTKGNPSAYARIVGTVLDQQGHPLRNISVHAVLEQTGMYMPTVNSSDTGQFVIEHLEPGTYDIFGESDAAAYPDTALSFYPNENPTKVTLGNFGTATVALVLGPRAGVLCGTVLDKTTGRPITSPHAPHLIVRKVSNREDSIEFLGPPRFRWLIPPATEVTLEVFAEGYRPWVYADLPDPLTPAPFRLESGDERTLDIQLEPETQPEHRPEWRRLFKPLALGSMSANGILRRRGQPSAGISPRVDVSVLGLLRSTASYFFRFATNSSVANVPT